MARTMKTNQEHFKARPQESAKEKGVALVYILIAIALFAAISMTFMRQNDTSEAESMSDDKAEILASQLIAYAAQTKSAVDQMLFSGAKINELDFTLPTAAGFDTGTLIYKVYHPQGGGVIPGRLSSEAVSQTDTDPVAGWYMGRFNNVEWTATASDDAILAAHQIKQKVCEKINVKINGSTSIPSLASGTLADYFIDDSFHTGTNADLTTDSSGSPVCAACDKMASLCVSNPAQNTYTFYTILADQ